MKLSQGLMKFLIRLISLMILFVITYMLGIVMYSARYWPDVYTYINSNITIKRIPTISELNITVIEVEYTTEFYTTDIVDVSTVDGMDSGEEFKHFFEDFQDNNRRKKDIEIEDGRDYSELPTRSVVVDYLFITDVTTRKEDSDDDEDASNNEETTRLFEDWIDEYKLTTSNSVDVEIVSGFTFALQREMLGGSCNGNASSAGLADVVYPWLASIFIKNSTSSNQFQYNCDGAILSERIILTAARCVSSEMTVDPENLLVVLGKKYLQSMASHERTHKIKEIYTHDNFTVKDGVACNDLAILVMEENAIFNEYIQPSCMSDKYGDFVQAATTAWDITGTLHPVYFEKMESQSCDHSNKDENTFCATYGNHIPLCPNYGGIYVTKQLDNQWYLQGIRTGDPTVRGLCFDKTVIFTSLKNHTEWISVTVDNIKQFY